jgi:hypothetical protein
MEKGEKGKQTSAPHPKEIHGLGSLEKKIFTAIERNP